MSLNHITTTTIRENFNLGGGDIVCNELFTNNLKYNIFTKTQFIPIVYINDETNQPSISENFCYFYTTGSHLVFFGNVLLTYVGSTIPAPNVYLTLPNDFENKVGSTFLCNNGSMIGIVPGNSQRDFVGLKDSAISLTPLNNIPSLRLNMVDEQSGGDISTSVYSLTFQSIFTL